MKKIIQSNIWGGGGLSIKVPKFMSSVINNYFKISMIYTGLNFFGNQNASFYPLLNNINRLINKYLVVQLDQHSQHFVLKNKGF